MAGTSLTTTDNFVDFETAHWGFWSPKCSKVKKTQGNPKGNNFYQRLLKTFGSMKWSASKFSLQYHCLIKQKGHESYGNDQYGPDC